MLHPFGTKPPPERKASPAPPDEAMECWECGNRFLAGPFVERKFCTSTCAGVWTEHHLGDMEYCLCGCGFTRGQLRLQHTKHKIVEEAS